MSLTRNSYSTIMNISLIMLGTIFVLGGTFTSVLAVVALYMDVVGLETFGVEPIAALLIGGIVAFVVGICITNARHQMSVSSRAPRRRSLRTA